MILLAALLVAVPVRADQADDQFAVAAGHYARQRWTLAVEEFQAFLQRYPSHPKANEAVFFLAEAQLQTGDLPHAEARFREYLGRGPGGRFARPALFRAGEAAYLAGKAQQAKADLERFQAAYPDDQLLAYVLPYLADIALGEGDAEAAARQFRDALKRFPQGRLQDDCRFGLARALEKQNQNSEAQRLYLAVAAKVGSPLADDAQFHLGALQYATGEYQPAIETFAAFQTRLQQSPWRSNARLGQGWALLKLKRFDEARAAFSEITSDPKVGIDARYWLGLTHKAQQQWPAAAETLLAAAHAAAADNALLPAIRFHAGDALLQAGRLDAAVEQFDQVIASPARDNQWIDDALRGKVQAALQAGDHVTLDRLAADLEQRFPDSPANRDVQRMRARSLVERKEHAAAVKLLEPLLAGDTAEQQSLEDKYLLAVAYQGLKRHQDALAVLLPVLDAAQGRLKSDALLTQASLLMALENYDQAVAPLEAFLASAPAAGPENVPSNLGQTGDQEVQGHAKLAICLARSGRIEKARTLYAELLQTHPQHTLLVPTTEQLAEAAYQAGDVEWSSELFRWLMTQSRSKEQQLKGMAGLGWSQLKAGRRAAAAETFQKLLQSDPPAELAAEAAMVRAQIFQQLDQPDPALAMYDLVIDKYPQSQAHPQALLAAARLRDNLQQDRQAAALYQRLATQYPEAPEPDTVLYEWAWVLNDLGETARSTALFERLRREHPNSRYRADATYRLARRALAAKDYSQAGELTSELLADDSDSGIREHALFLQGQIAVAQQDWDQVGQTFAAFTQQFPQSPSRLVAEYWTAETAYRHRDYETAGKLLESLAQRTQGRREPWMAMIPLRRAQVLAQSNKWSEAYVIASKIEAEYPGFLQQHEVDYLLGRCLANRADFQGAREAYLEVIRSPTGAKTETAAMAQWMVGETYFHQRNYEAALREYLKVEILYAYPTWQAAALLQAAKCHDLLGETKQADRLYARLIKEHPGTEFAREAIRRMGGDRYQRGGGDPPD